MRPAERDNHIAAIEGLKDILKSPEAKELINAWKKMLIMTALEWLEKFIKKLTKTTD
jgi:hypothetical protein